MVQHYLRMYSTIQHAHTTPLHPLIHFLSQPLNVSLVLLRGVLLVLQRALQPLLKHSPLSLPVSQCLLQLLHSHCQLIQGHLRGRKMVKGLLGRRCGYCG